MQLSRFFLCVASLLLPVALIGTTWLYLYPILHGCAFPTPPPTTTHAHAQPSVSAAPFRLLALGDPQLEGDSSLPDPNALVFPSLETLVPDLRNASNFTEFRDIVRGAAKGVLKDAGVWVEGKRKAVDLWGNDRYLAHIVACLRWWTGPTHVSVLGDLLGSQWVTDGEFRKRAGRYWGVVMRGLEKVPDGVFGGVEEVVDEMTMTETTAEPTDYNEKVDETTTTEPTAEPTAQSATDYDNDATLPDSATERDSQPTEETYPEQPTEEVEEDKKPPRKALWGGTTEVLGADKNWEKRVINIAGNHDIGYGGDIDESRIERFERAFGSVNWDIWFTLPDELRPNKTANPSIQGSGSPPTLRLVILNTMNLDTPAWSTELQTETYDYMNRIITTSLPVDDKTHATILLTHIPLEKEAGICVDGPYFDFFENGGGLKEQNMLSGHSSKTILEGVFGMTSNKDAEGRGFGRRGIIVNGHDHAGCDVVHYIRQPGVDDVCRVEQVKSHEAYWPTSTANDTMIATSMDINGVDINMVVANETDTEAKRRESVSDTEADPIEPVSESSPESPPEPPEPAPPTWRARRFPHRPYEISPQNECTSIDASPHIREITLRSMMGEYSGYAGFLSAWFDEARGDKGEWVLEFSTCGLGIQHWWWGFHVVDLIVVVCLLAAGVAAVGEKVELERRIFADGEKKLGQERKIVEERKEEDKKTAVNGSARGGTVTL
ncbi:polarized growth [Pyrenophora seminiperda CCB06]|uniref:Polarized growth n=1 Tax=Pyrenophora seminiperda CCB06 TaxID=1302712 RepID=A0A3M7M1R3_9PLEO|nr:polarized growth [Pyrenophora seminiperda CCB06]